MGQRSLMPGQCPGLPGFGYATGPHAILNSFICLENKQFFFIFGENKDFYYLR